jgi:hypothetical protein
MLPPISGLNNLVYFRQCHYYGGYDFEDPGVNGRIILKGIFKKWDGSMDWIELAHDRDRWRSFVNAVINLQVP